MGRIKDLTSALPTETDAFVFDGSNGTKKLTYSNLKQVLIDDVSDDVEEEIRQIYVIDNSLDESSAHAVANSAVARAINANSSAIDSMSDIMSSMQTSQNNLSGRVDDLEEDVDDLNDSVVSPYETKQMSGGIASFKNGAGDIPLKSLVVSIEPKQAGSGDPSPSNIRAISGFTAANITRTGKNLLSHINLNNTVSGITYVTNSDGSITLSGTATANRFNVINSSLVLPAGTYISTLEGRVNYVSLGIFDIENDGYLPSTFTLTEPRELRIYLTIYSGAVTNITVYPMIRPASFTDATYEPYKGDTYNVSFGSAGTVYGGTLDVTNGLLTATWGALNLGGFTYGGGNGAYFYSSIGTKAKGIENLLCSIYKTVNTSVGSMPNYSIKGNGDNTNFYIMDNRYTTGAELKAALNGIYAVFELADPISYQLTPMEVRTILGQNNIWSNTGSVIECEYRRDLQEQLLSMLVTESESGSIASFGDGAEDLPVKSLVVNITPKQAGSGDPSPTNVRAISGYTGANIIRAGKNMIGDYAINGTYSGITYVTNADGSITVSGTSTGARYNVLKQEMIFPPGTYVGSIGMNVFEVYPYNIDTGSRYPALAPFTLTDYTRVRIYLTIYANQTANGTLYPMIRPVAFDDTYEPYNSNTYNISFGSAGTIYGGTLDVTSGILTVTWNAWNMGRFTYSYNADGAYFYSSIGDKASGNHNIISSIYKTTSATSVTQMSDYEIKGHPSSNIIYLKDSRYTDGASLKAALEGQMFACEISNPVSYQLTPTEVRSLLGNNNIWSDTGSVASCEYRADTSLVINKLINAIVSLGGNI